MQSKPIVFILLAASAVFAAALLLKNARPPQGADWRTARVGVVRDAASGRPIAGAFVVARWIERSAARFEADGVIAGRCLDRVVARSDDAGRFAIPARANDGALDPNWNPLRTHRYERDLTVYASGYLVRAQDAAPSDADAGHADAPISFALRSEQGDVAQRLARLADAAQGVACDAQIAQAPVSEAIDADAYALACRSADGNETAFAELRAALRGHRAADDAHPCAPQHTVSTASP